jgi:hypothetical protein
LLEDGSFRLSPFVAVQAAIVRRKRQTGAGSPVQSFLQDSTNRTAEQWRLRSSDVTRASEKRFCGSGVAFLLAEDEVHQAHHLGRKKFGEEVTSVLKKRNGSSVPWICHRTFDQTKHAHVQEMMK